MFSSKDLVKRRSWKEASPSHAKTCMLNIQAKSSPSDSLNGPLVPRQYLIHCIFTVFRSIELVRVVKATKAVRIVKLVKVAHV